MDKSKKIRIEVSYEEFAKMIFELYEPNMPTVQKVLERKVNSMYLHDLYSKSMDKTLSEKEREKARQQYLDSKGIPDAFRWSKEYQEKRLFQ